MTMNKEEKEYLKLKLGTLSEDDRKEYSRHLVKAWLKEFRTTPTPAPTNGHRRHIAHPGPTLNIPADKSVVKEVQEAMRAFPGDSKAASRSINMGSDNYTFIKRLILINDKPFLSREEKATIKRCFDFIESERRIRPIKTIGDNVIKRHWNTRRESNYTVAHRRKRFDVTVIAINEGCESTVNMELPDNISEEEVAKTLGSLARSIELLGKLMQKLVGEGVNDNGQV